VVLPNGHLTDFEILGGARGVCGEEVIRLFKSMPAWKPGEKDGEQVASKMSIPIRFKKLY